MIHPSSTAVVGSAAGENRESVKLRSRTAVVGGSNGSNRSGEEGIRPHG